MPHLGNYLGALRAWVLLQESTRAGVDEVSFCIADLHALSGSSPLFPPRAKALPAAVRQTAACLLAVGLDASRVTLFRQSAVRAHGELAWVLGCATPVGWLDRMTQFKAKAKAAAAAASAAGARGAAGAGTGADAAGASLGLYAYPVLQAADILLYGATEVPVGADQTQHIELARGVADSWNRAHGLAPDNATALPLPRAIALPGGAPRVMSLRDGRAKMSKSAPSDLSRINLTDGDDAIVDKVRRAKTDSAAGVWLYDPAVAPEKSNLLAILGALTGEAPAVLAERYAGVTAERFKADLAEALVATLRPVRERAAALAADPSHLDALLRAGAARARSRAAVTMRLVREVSGLDGGIGDADPAEDGW